MEKDLLKIRQLIALRRFDLAEIQLKDYLSKNPEHSYPIGLLSTCYYFLQDFPKAILFSEKAISINPISYEQPYVILGFIYSDVGKIKKAEKYIKEGLKLFPFEHRFFILKSKNEMIKKNFKKAEKFATQGLAIAPESSRLLNLKASALNHRKKNKEAEKVLNLALQIDPLNSETLKNKGWIALEHQQYERAKSFFGSSLQQNPTDSESQYGFKLAILAKFKWMQFSLRILLYLRKFGGLVLIGIIAGVAPQMGKMVMDFWESPSIFNPMLILLGGILLFFWTPIFPYHIALIRIQKEKENQKYFQPREFSYAKKLTVAYFFVLIFFIFAIIKINS